MKNCIDEGTLQACFDRELAGNDAAKVAAHLNDCAQCAETARTVEAENLILSEGLSTEFAAAIPTERLRQRVDAAVAGLHFPRVPTIRESRWHAIARSLNSFRPPAYALVATIIVLAGFVTFTYLKNEKTAPVTAQNDSQIVIPATPKEPGDQPPTPVSTLSPQPVQVHRTKPIRRSAPGPDATSLSWQERQYEYAIARLNEAIGIQPPMRPSLRVEYEYNMALIDNAIATSRDAARKNPKDPQATQSMLDAYQSKVDLMNQVADARVLER